MFGGCPSKYTAIIGAINIGLIKHPSSGYKRSYSLDFNPEKFKDGMIKCEELAVLERGSRNVDKVIGGVWGKTENGEKR